MRIYLPLLILLCAGCGFGQQQPDSPPAPPAPTEPLAPIAPPAPVFEPELPVPVCPEPPVTLPEAPCALPEAPGSPPEKRLSVPDPPQLIHTAPNPRAKKRKKAFDVDQGVKALAIMASRRLAKAAGSVTFSPSMTKA